MTGPAGSGRALFWGGLFLALPMLATTLLAPVLGAQDTGLFVLFMLTLLGGAGACFVLLGDGMVRIAWGMCTMVGAAFVSLGVTEARIIGPVPAVTVAEAPAHHAAAGFILTDAAPDAARQRTLRASHTGRVRLSGAVGRSVTVRSTFTVAPVLRPDSDGSESVRLVAVIDHGGMPVAEAARQVPPWPAGGGLIRLLPDPLRDAAVRQALAEARLPAAPDLVIGRWVGDPAWMRPDAARPVLTLFGCAFAIWAALVWTRPVPGGGQAKDDAPPGLAGALLAGAAGMGAPALLGFAMRLGGAEPSIGILAVAFASVAGIITTLPALRSSGRDWIGIGGILLPALAPTVIYVSSAGPDDSWAGTHAQAATTSLVVFACAMGLWAALVLADRALAPRGARRP